MLTAGVDLWRSLGSIKIKALLIYIFTKALICLGLKHDLNKSTPPAGMEVSEQLARTNWTRPFFSAKKKSGYARLVPDNNDVC